MPIDMNEMSAWADAWSAANLPPYRETIITGLELTQAATQVLNMVVDLGGVDEVLEAAKQYCENIPEMPLGPNQSVVIGGQELETEIQAQERAASEPETVAPPAEPLAPVSTEIGGPLVDSHLGEIKNLQAQHDEALKALEDQRDKALNDQAAKDQQMARTYFDAHPDQSPEERSADEKKLEAASDLNRKDVEAKYADQIATLKSEQSVEMATLAARQAEAPPPPPPPSPAPPPPQR